MLPVHAQFATRLRSVAGLMRSGIHKESHATLVGVAAKAIDDLATRYSSVRAERDALQTELNALRDAWRP